MKVRTIFAASALVLLSMAGCKSSSTPEQDLANLPPLKDSHEAAQKITTTFRTVDVDGSKIKLADTSYTENGKQIFCQQYVKIFSAATRGNPTEIQVDKTCTPCLSVSDEGLKNFLPSELEHADICPPEGAVIHQK